jgi:hypothetical protein
VRTVLVANVRPAAALRTGDPTPPADGPPRKSTSRGPPSSTAPEANNVVLETLPEMRRKESRSNHPLGPEQTFTALTV